MKSRFKNPCISLEEFRNALKEILDQDIIAGSEEDKTLRSALQRLFEDVDNSGDPFSLEDVIEYVAIWVQSDVKDAVENGDYYDDED